MKILGELGVTVKSEANRIVLELHIHTTAALDIVKKIFSEQHLADVASTVKTAMNNASGVVVLGQLASTIESLALPEGAKPTSVDIDPATGRVLEDGFMSSLSEVVTWSPEEQLVAMIGGNRGVDTIRLMRRVLPADKREEIMKDAVVKWQADAESSADPKRKAMAQEAMSILQILRLTSNFAPGKSPGEEGGLDGFRKRT